MQSTESQLADRRDSKKKLRNAVWLMGLLAPSLLLLPLGSLWLWQNGFLLYWAIAAATMVLLAALLQRWLFPESNKTPTAKPVYDGQTAHYTPAENAAWSAVLEIVQNTDVNVLQSRDDILLLGAKTIDAVARKLHPEVVDPLWQFTVPEALALTERVSRRLRTYVIDNIPLGDRLTVAQLLAAYRWRGAINVAEKAYDIWRVVRLMNPVTAATNELREQLSKHILDKSRTHLTETLMSVFVREVGRAAIDLYGGRLRVLGSTAYEPATDLKNASTVDSESVGSTGPVRILFVSKDNRLTAELTEAMSADATAPLRVLSDNSGASDPQFGNVALQALLIATSEINGTPASLKSILTDAMSSDAVIYVLPNLSDFDLERSVSLACAEQFARLPNRRSPPTLVIIAAENDTTLKSRDAVAHGFSINPARVIHIPPKSLSPTTLQPLWSQILQAMPEAQHTKFVRAMHDHRSKWRLGNVWLQAIGAGKELGRTLRR